MIQKSIKYYYLIDLTMVKIKTSMLRCLLGKKMIKNKTVYPQAPKYELNVLKVSEKLNACSQRSKKISCQRNKKQCWDKVSGTITKKFDNKISRNST